MKKLLILALAAVLVVFFTLPAAALENEFGGYWRTRYFSQKYFTGYDRGDRTGVPIFDDEGNVIDEERAEDDTVERADTRTRLYYTAKINDNLKLVNKFEMDAVFGDSSPSSRNYGRVGADGVDVQVKNSYADFNLGPVNVTAGVQPYSLFRDFFISDDASGIIARWKAMDNFVLAGSWLKSFEGGEGDKENEDLDTYTLTGAFWFNENISIKPSVSWAYSDQLRGSLAKSILERNFGGVADGANIPNWDFTQTFGEASLWTMGLDFDMTFDKWGLWATGVAQFGEIEDVKENFIDPVTLRQREEDVDTDGYLVAVGGNVGFGDLWIFGDFGLHSEFFIASGDDSDLNDDYDDDYEAFINPFGSYYWSEIMGLGIFDNRANAGSPGDKIQNIWAINLGVDMKPLDKLKITLDYWYAELVESEQRLNDEDTLGHEVNAILTYELVEGLNLDLVGAYLWADDAVATGFRDNEEDPYEYGARLSLSF